MSENIESFIEQGNWDGVQNYLHTHYQDMNLRSVNMPGDFRTVRQSLFYYGGDVTNTQRLNALEREAAAKEGGAFSVHGKLGFN